MKTRSVSLPVASPMQTSMLMASLRGDPFQPYVQQFRWTFNEQVDWNQMKQAWIAVFKRHDTFYHHFQFSERGQLAVEKKEQLQVRFRHRDWSRLAPDRQKSRIKEFLDRDLNAGFNPQNETLCRLTLLRLGSNCNDLVWTSHHALFDGRARLILIHEFLETWEAIQKGQQPQLPKAPSYETYLNWCQRQSWEKSKLFWEEVLKGIDETTPLSFGLDTHPEKNDSISRSSISRFIDPPLSHQLHQWTEKSGLSLNILVQAAWGLYLSRTCGKQAVVFAAPRACRKSNVPEADKTVGLFVNTVPVVVRINEKETIQDYLTRTRNNWTEMRDHENTPLTLIKEVSEIPKNKALFTSLAGFEKYQLNQLIKTPGKSRHQFSLTGFTDLPLVVQLHDGEKVKVEIAFDETQFSHASIEGVIVSFITILRQLTDDASRCLETVEIVDKDKLKCIRKLSTGKRPSLAPQPVHRIFENLCRKYPGRIAIRFQNQSITYSELNATSNQIARHLIQAGVKPGTHVGLFMERSDLVLAAQLAVIKAGGVYVPFDVEYPKDRLRWMIKDSRPTVVLATSKLKKEIKEARLKPLFLDEDRKRWSRLSKSNLPGNNSWEAAAYIMYTSGSTGRPKGVIVPHRGIVRLVQKPDYVKLSTKTRTLQLAPVSFDASTFEIWAPLLNGGTCILYPERVPAVLELEKILQAESINTLWLTASLFNFLIDAAPGILRVVKQLLVGGEALSPVHIRKAQEHLPGTQLINGYGPTENTTFSCCYPIPSKHPMDRPVPIGPPISHSTAYVLDKNKRQLPTGVPGELYVGGLGVALGYLNNPKLTRERFVQNPYASSRAPVLYKTGDRVFQREDGLIEYLERFDDQVKIRGYRIEPGEIQSQIQRLKEVENAAVLVWKNQRAENELAAFVVLKRGSETSEQSLKQQLASHLPGYMVPSSIVFMSSLPLTSNGKINRTALLEYKPGTQQSVTKPAGLTSTQKSVCNIWKEVLGSDPAHLDEDFFKAGGNSLLATNFVYKIQTSLSIHIPFPVFHKRSSVRSLAQWIEDRMGTGDRNPRQTPLIVEAAEVADVSELNLMWNTFYRAEIENTSKVVPPLICRNIILEGHLNAGHLATAINYLVNLHDAMRMHAIEVEGNYYQKIEPPMDVDVPLIDLSQLSPREAMKRARIEYEKEWTASMNIREAPLFRPKIFKLEKQKHILSLVFHHAITDGLSVELFYHQLSQAYGDLVKDRPISIKPPAISFRQLDKGIKQWLANGNGKRITEYWEKTLREVKPIKLPFLIKKPPALVDSNIFDHYQFPHEWSDRIKQFTETHSLSTYVFFCTVFKVVIARYTGEMESYISTGADYRSGPEQADIFGLLANPILIRNKLKRTKTFLEQAESVREALFQAQENRFISPITTPAIKDSKVHRIYKVTNQFQVAMGPDTGDSLRMEGIRITQIPRKKLKALYGLGIIIREPEQGLQLTFRYVPEIFVPHSIERFKINFQKLLSLILDNPKLRLDQLPDLSTPSAYQRPLSNSEKNQTMLLPLEVYRHATPSISVAGKTGPHKSKFHNGEKPHTTQKTIWKLWEEVLEQAPASLDEDFFEAGGHSLLATNLIFKIQSAFSQQLPLETFLNRKTVRSIAEWIDGRLKNSKSNLHQEPFTLKAVRIDPISNLGIRWRKFYYPDIEKPGSTQSHTISRAILLNGPLQIQYLKEAIECVLNLHERFRTCATEIDGKFFEKIESRVYLDIPVIDLSKSSPEDAQRAAKAIFEEESTAHLNMRHAPLMRVKLLKLELDKHWLILIIHHGIADGVSVQTFYAQISQAYNELGAGNLISLAAPKYTFRQFERCLEDWHEKGHKKQLKTYWEEKVHDLKPIDYPFLIKTIPESPCWNFLDHNEFYPEWAGRIKAFTQKHRISTYIFFTSVIKMMVARYTGELVSYASSGIDARSGEDQADIIGDLSANILFRNKLENCRPFLEQAEQDRAALYEALDHKLVNVHEAPSIANDRSHPIHKIPFQLQIYLSPETGDSLNFTGIRKTLLRRKKLRALSRLGFIICEPEDGLQVSFNYAHEIYLKHGFERLKHNFQWFLRLVLDKPHITLEELPDLTVPQAYNKRVSEVEKRTWMLRPIDEEGKVDLSTPETGDSENALQDSTLFNKTQKRLAGFWEEVMGKKPKGIDEDFFEAGGHSLLATSLIYKIQSHFTIRLAINDFQHCATIGKLAQRIDQLDLDPYGGKGAPFSVRSFMAEPLNELSLAWNTSYKSDIVSPDTTATNHIVRGIILDGILKTEILVKAIESAFNLHERFRTYAVEIDGGYFENIVPHIPLNVLQKDLSHLPPKEALHQAKTCYNKMSRDNISMRESPMLRVSLLRLEKRKHFLCLGINHAIGDGHSLGLFLKQISQAYNDLSQKRPVALLPSKFSYYQYEKSLKSWLDSGNRKRIHNYFRKQTRGIQPIDFPFLKKRLPLNAKWNVFDHHEFPEPWAKRIHDFTETHSISTYLFFTTLVKWMIARYSGNLDSYIASSTNARSGPEEEEIAGEISTVILVRNQLKGTRPFTEQIRLDQTSFYEAMEHRRISITSFAKPFQRHGGNIHKLGGQCRVSYAPDFETEMRFNELETTTWLRKRLPALMRLGFVIREPKDRLLLAFQYAPEIYVAHSFERLKHNFQKLLQLVLDNPEISLNQLPDLSTPSAYRRPLTQSEKNEAILIPLDMYGNTTPRPTADGNELPGESKLQSREALNNTQRTIWKLWKEVLEEPPANLDQDFVEAGGNSLLATNLIFKIHAQFSVHIPFRVFHDHASVRGLSQWLDEQKYNNRADQKTAPFALEPIKIEPISDLSLKWRTFFYPDIVDPENTRSMLIGRALLLEGNLNRDLLHEALERVINLHEEFRTHAVEIEGGYFRKVEPEVRVEIPRIDFSHLPENVAFQKAQSIFENECETNLSIYSSPLFRIKLIKVGKHKNLLSLIVHHAISDGVSLEIIYRQTSEAYNDLLNGRPVALKPSKFSFRQYEKNLERWLADGNGKRIRCFLEKQLKNLKPIEYPFLVKKLPALAAQNVYENYRLPRDWSIRVKEFSRKYSVSTYVFHTTIMKLVVARYTGQLDSYAVTAVNGREGPDQAGIVGNMGNSILIRTRLHETGSFVELATAVKHSLHDSLENKYISIRSIGRELTPDTPTVHKLTGQLQVVKGPDTGESLNLDGVGCTLIPRKKLGGRVRLGIVLRESADSTAITFQYAPNLFIPHGIERFKYNFQRFMRLVLDNPELTLRQFPDLRKPAAYSKPLSSTEKKTLFLLPATPNRSNTSDSLQIPPLLPGPGKARCSSGLSPTQKTIWGFWTEVLKKEPESLDEDFFEAGGHSLLASDLIYKIQSAFSVNLPYATFIKNPSAGVLARLIEVESAEESPQKTWSPLTLKPVEIPKISKLSIKWQTFYVPEIADPENTQSLVISRAILLEGSLKPKLFHKAMEHVINLHERFRTHAVEIDGAYYEQIEPKIQLPMPRIDLTDYPPAEVMKRAKAIFRKESTCNLNLRSAPLFRTKLIRLDRDKFLLSLVVNHAIADGYSLEIFYRQTSQAYNDLINNRPISLKPSQFSFRQYDLNLEAWLAQGNEKRITRFWEKQLRGIKPIAYPFLIKHIPEKVMWNHFDHYEFLPEWVHRINRFSERHSLSTFQFFTTLIKWLVARYTKDMDSYLSSAVDSRTGPLEEEIAGDFGSTILIRNRLSGTRSFMTQAEADRKTLFQAMDHIQVLVHGIKSQRENPVHHIHSPVGQMQFIQAPDTGETLSLEHVKSTFLPRRKLGALTRLALVMRQPKDRLLMTFAYAPDLFVPNGIERFNFNFQSFVKLVVANPGITLNRLPDLSKPAAFKKPLTQPERKEFILKPIN